MENHTALTLTIELSGQEVTNELHKLIDSRYKDSYVIKSILVKTGPVVRTDFGISFKVQVDIDPTMNKLAGNQL